MKPAEASSADAERSRTDEEKRALIEEYDAADYKGRFGVLDREQITLRHISRWRSETRGANLRVAGARTAPKRPKKVVPPPEPVVAPEPAEAPAPVEAAPQADVVEHAVPAAERPAPKPRRSRKPAATKPVAVEPSAPVAPAVRVAPARTKPLAATKPTAARQGAGRPGTSAPPSSRRQRRRGTADAAASALRDAALTHVDQIIHHADALQRLLSDEAWHSIAATTGTTEPDTAGFAKKLKLAESAARSVRDSLAATGPQHGSVRDAEPSDGRGRKPWWGAAAE